jgi:solute carrier family 13 (sodium-dependent dicarboxylate transporter), member 2/3/5
MPRGASSHALTAPPPTPLPLHVRLFAFLLGPALAGLMLLTGPMGGMGATAWKTAALGVLMVIWWVTEAVPIAATALLPIALLPLLGVMNVGAATAPYANPVIYLFFGGFVLAAAFERSGLHRRLALRLLTLVGTRPDRVIGGFMLTCGFISMWVSNTAATLMLLPLARPLFRRHGEGAAGHFEKALLLGIAYSATIGGFGTPIGSPPNALLTAFLAQNHGIRVRFVDYMLFGVPIVLIALPVAWVILTRVVFRVQHEPSVVDASSLAEERRALGPASRAEKFVALVGVLTALAWMAQPLLARAWPAISEAGISVMCALALLLVPLDARGTRAISWDDAERIPWGVLVLFGGGLSLAAAIQEGGLAAWITESVRVFEGLPPLVLIIMVTVVVTVLTEFTSNTATAAAFLPIASSLAVGAGMTPLVLVAAAGLAASNGFMLPVGTPPNAIAFSTGRLTVREMARAGLLVDVVFVAILTLVAYFLVAPVLG